MPVLPESCPLAMSPPPEHPEVPSSPERQDLRVGEWTVRQAEGILSADGRTVRLEPRVMDLLVHLAGQPEKVVSKEELMEAVWGGAIVEEGALSQAVHSLRKILGDDARQPRYIQTIPKRGYRLMAPVLPGTLLEPPGIGGRPPAGSLGRWIRPRTRPLGPGTTAGGSGAPSPFWPQSPACSGLPRSGDSLREALGVRALRREPATGS